MNKTFCFVILQICLLSSSVPAQTSDNPSAAMQSSPYRNLEQNRQLLNTIGAQVLLFLEYQSQSPQYGTSSLSNIPGIQEPRYFERAFANGTIRIVEVGLMAQPEGGYDLYLYGREQYSNGSWQANPDLPYIQSSLQSIVQAIQTRQNSPGPSDVGHRIYHLSYIQSDRAIALLKTLGYTTVEYTQAAGETLYDRVYAPYQNGEWKLPVVVKLIDPTKTSLMDPSPVAAYQQQAQQHTINLGGTFLHQMTSGEPHQRLLIVYNKNNAESVETLLTLLRDQIDRPARQIVIEALVIEINTDKAQELGIDLRAVDSNYDVSYEKSETGQDLPFSFTFNRTEFLSDFLFFKSRVSALVQSGEAEILSSPSVLVLNGRQARIQIGQQVPSTTTTTTTGYATQGVNYIQTGIVLNLRPRISEDGTEVTMQVETIVSAVNEAQSIQSTSGASGQVLLAPRIDNRQVQTFVRVADNTPFIIGGLISTDVRESHSGVPILSDIPLLGLAFKRRKTDNIKKEVIVVLTPHVLPLEEKNFSYVIPKDTDLFHSFDNLLFRNAYRIRDDDVFDLKFIYESEFFKTLLTQIESQAQNNPMLKIEEPYHSLLEGGVPGEEILVRRMLWELAYKTGFAAHIDDARIIVFEDRPEAADSSGFRTSFTHSLLAARKSNGQNTLTLTFDARLRGTPGHPFAQPKATIGYTTIASSEDYVGQLMSGNRRLPDGSPNRWTVQLSDINPPGVRGATSLEVLKGVLVLKRILALNKTLPLTVKEFRVGRQLIFPTEQDLKQRFHILDRDAARYFYEAVQYYPEFEKAFNRETKSILSQIEGQSP